MPETAKKILVAFDDSPSSHKAFEFALDLARNGLGGPCQIRVLSVVQSPDLIDVPMDIEPIVESARSKLETAQQALIEKANAAQQKISTECIVGHASEIIVDYANHNHYDLVILGNRGRSRIAEWLLGSVSHQIATHARCTVTIVK